MIKWIKSVAGDPVWVGTSNVTGTAYTVMPLKNPRTIFSVNKWEIQTMVIVAENDTHLVTDCPLKEPLAKDQDGFSSDCESAWFADRAEALRFQRDQAEDMCAELEHLINNIDECLEEIDPEY